MEVRTEDYWGERKGMESGKTLTCIASSYLERLISLKFAMSSRCKDNNSQLDLWSYFPMCHFCINLYNVNCTKHDY